MKKITKKDIKQIREGHHGVFLDCLDFLLDSHNEPKWDMGYNECLKDMCFHAQRLAEHLHLKFGTNRVTLEVTFEQLAKEIEDYFNEKLKNI